MSVNFEFPKHLQRKELRFLLLNASEENDKDGKPFGKRPLPKLPWKTNTFSHDQLPAMLEKYPQAAKNRVGYACSKRYGVLDLDAKGKDFEELVARAKKMLPETFTVRTPGGGLHFYFELESEAKP